MYINAYKPVTIKKTSKEIEIIGPKGVVKKNFWSAPFDLKFNIIDKNIQLNIWYGNKKKIANLNTICAHILNLIAGVTFGFRYRMRIVYEHFPINTIIMSNKKGIEIKNFLGEKRTRIIYMCKGVKVFKNKNIKDEIVIEGVDLNSVSLSASMIQQSCLVRKKDIRKFLDGIYTINKEKIM